MDVFGPAEVRAGHGEWAKLERRRIARAGAARIGECQSGRKQGQSTNDTRGKCGAASNLRRKANEGQIARRLSRRPRSPVADAPAAPIKSRLARAREKLRICLQGYRELLPDTFRLEEQVNL
jgi:hypothetical protein